MIRRTVVLSLSALVLGIMAAPAGAAAPELRGVVSGSPYGASSGYIAVPVLYSKMSARRTGLKSPVGLMVIKRSSRVKVNGAPSTRPVGLRVGDRFKGNAEVSSLNRRIFYPRITFDRPPVVYFRSKELSLSELTRLIQAVQKDLAALTGQFGALAKYTVDGFRSIAAQIAALQKQIDDLKKLIAPVDLSGLQRQIDDLSKRVDDLAASLANYARKGDLAGFLKAVDVQAMIDAAIAGLDLLTDSDVNALIASAVTALNLDQYATDTDVASLTARLNALCTSLADATVDPDGSGPLPAVPVTLPGFGTACP